MVRSDTAVLLLDLAPYKLKPGDRLRFRLEARDRKGQIASTVERTIHIAADNNAADRQLARFDKQQESFAREAAQADRRAREGQPTDAADGGEIRVRGRGDSPGEDRRAAAPPRPRRRKANPRKSPRKRAKAWSNCVGKWQSRQRPRSGTRARRSGFPASCAIWRTRPSNSK